jgi:hypothetical protein
MPINPNIALGIQPVQQPNILGQMAQITAIRAAQQEMEGSEATQNYFAKPKELRGDPSQLLGTKQGQAAYKALNEGQIKQLEAEQKKINLVGAGAGAVLENPTMETFTTVVSDLVNRGIYTPQQRDQAFAAIGNNPSKIKAFVTPIFNQAISAEKRLSDITSRRNQDVASGASYGQLDLARKKDAREQAELDLIRKVLTGGVTPPATAPVAPPMGGGGGVTSTTQTAPVTGAVPQTNVLADQVAPQSVPDVNVNALAGGDAQQQIAAIDAKINALLPAGPKATSIVQALIAQKNSILTAEKNKYGEITTLQGVNPETNKPETYRARFNNITKQYEAIPENEPVVSVSLSGAGSSKLNAAKPPQTPTPFQSELGTQQARKVVESRTIAQDAADIMETNEIGRKILDSGAITGAGANFFVGLNQALKTAGVDFGYADAAANSQAYVALMAQNTAKLIKQFGAGTGLSDADREYAMKAAGGQINLDEKAMRRVLDINDRAARNSIDRHNKSVKGIKSDIPLTVEIPKSGSSRVYTSTEQQALEWANSNANDPRAAQIKQRLGAQ